MSRIGLLFGSFNPVHNGHLEVAKAALAAGCSDVWLVVQARNPYKAQRDLPAFQHRFTMVELAAQPHSRLHAWETTQDPPHIVSTLLALRAQNPKHEYILIMGQDLVDTLPQWPDFAEVMATAGILCFPRSDAAVSGFKHRNVVPLPVKPISVSSGLIRERLAEGKLITDLTPTPVAQYITANKLYI